MPSILLIGAERGLGLGLAHQFLDRGWDVVATALPGSDTNALSAARDTCPDRLNIVLLDVTSSDTQAFETSLGDRRFDVVFSIAGIWGAMHQSVEQASDAELADVMLVNCFGPIRLAHRLLNRLTPTGTYAFMTSHRASITINIEGGLELYRASKVALNMLARGIWASHRERDLTMLLIHPGWVKTEMGTLGGTVSAEMELEPSVRGVADIVERHRGSGDNLYVDWQDQPLAW